MQPTLVVGAPITSSLEGRIEALWRHTTCLLIPSRSMCRIAQLGPFPAETRSV